MVTVEITETLYAAIQISTAMSSTTVPAFIAATLRETQVRFFATTSANDEDPEPVEILDGRAAVPPPSMRPLLGVRREILDRLIAAPVSPGADVFDVIAARRSLLNTYSGPAVSRGVRQLIERGVLVPVVPTATGFQPADGAGDRVRYVRLRGGS